MAFYGQSATGKSIKLGALLMRSGIVQPEEFSVSLTRSKQCDTLVGNVLLKMGFLSQDDLACALHLQSLIMEGSLTSDLAARALKYCHEQGASPQAALQKLGWKGAPPQKIDEIGCLLTQSGFVSKSLYYCVVSSTKTAFGLVLKGALRCDQFDEVLKAASLVESRVCTLEQAAEALTLFRTRGIAVEDALRREFGLPVHKTSLRLGQLLVSACILSEAEVLVAVEQSLRSRKRLGQCLPFGTRVTPFAVDICLELQALASVGILSAAQAAKIARTCIDEKLTMAAYLKQSKALRENEQRSAQLVEILKQAQLITDQDVKEALVLTGKFSLGPIAALAATKRIDANIYRALWYCDGLMQKQSLKSAQAVVAILWCQRTGGDAAEAVVHISGVFTGLSEAAQASSDEPLPLRKVESESHRLYQMMQKEKQTPYTILFGLGVVLVIAVLALSAAMMSEHLAIVVGVSVLLGLSVYLSLLALSQQKEKQKDDEILSLAAICAVRKKRTSAKPETQTSIAS